MPNTSQTGYKQELLSRQTLIERRIEVVRETTRRDKWGYRELRHKPIPGFCNKCCLPWDKHVEHEPPDAPPKPKAFTPGTPEAEAYREWRLAFLQWYRVAVSVLTDDEFLKMPLPVNVVRLQVLADECVRRFRQKAPSAWERLDDSPF